MTHVRRRTHRATARAGGKTPSQSASEKTAKTARSTERSDAFRDGRKSRAGAALQQIFQESRRLLAAGVRTVAEPFLISALVNGVGTAVVHFAFGVPFDPNIMATFQAVGTAIGVAYPAMRGKAIELVEAVKDQLADAEKA